MANFLKVFTSYRMLIVLLLGFSSGIPLGLTGATLQAWMRSAGVDLTTIGLFALVGTPYTFKFAWAPLMDRYVPPFLGRRRGWALIAQVALILCIFSLGTTDPITAPSRMALLAFLVAFTSATQDIALDAYRTEVLKPEEYGAGAGLFVMGYRLAMLVSGAVALILSDHLPWSQVYLIMAACILVGVIATIFAPEPTTQSPPPKSIMESYIGPLSDYFKRKGGVEILVFIVLYKLGDVLAGMMTTPFMIDLGFTRTDIGAVNKVFGLIATIVGGLFGGAVLSKVGIERGLWIFGFGQAFSNLMFMVLASTGYNYPVMVSAIAIENLTGGMGTAAFTAFLMMLCNQRFTATQFALLTSLMAQTRVFAGAPSGWLAQSLGWQPYFLATTVLAAPGLLMLLRYKRWATPSSEPA